MKKKIIIIIILIILILAVVGVLYFETDLLKDKGKMYQEYLSQGIEQIEQNVDLSTNKEYSNLLKNENYEDSTQLTVNYTNSQNQTEKYTAQISGVTDNTNKLAHRKIEIKYGDNTNVLDVEFLKENEIYGLMFSNVVDKFISIENSNIEETLEKININYEDIEEKINEGKELIERINVTEEEKEIIKNAYLNVLNHVNSKQYSFEKEEIITLSDTRSVTTKSYTLELTNTQTKELFINILKQLKEETYLEQIGEIEEIPSLITTAYVEEENIVRLLFECGSRKIRIDLYGNNINIKYENSVDGETQTSVITIQRQDDNYVVEYEDYNNKKVIVDQTIQKSGNGTNMVETVKYSSNDITGVEVSLKQNITLNSETSIERTFDNTGNVLLNNYDTDTANSAVKSLWNLVNSHLLEVQDQINSELLDKLLNYNTQIEDKVDDAQETAKDKFNSQFELYKGENIETEVVLNMLDVAGKNMTSYQSIGEDKIEIYIKQDHENSTMSEKIKKQIEDKKTTYNISFKYDENGKISTITIEDYVEEENN